MGWQRQIPNVLTASRIVLSPVVFSLLAFAADSPARNGWVLGLVIFAAMSDLVDGKLARRFGLDSDFGRIMDPVSDSAFTMSVVLGLCAAPRFAMPLGVPLLLFYRELFIQVVRRVFALRQIVLPALLSGKIKSYVQALALVGLFGVAVWQDGQMTGELVSHRLARDVGVLLVLANVASMVEYAVAVRRLAPSASAI